MYYRVEHLVFNVCARARANGSCTGRGYAIAFVLWCKIVTHVFNTARAPRVRAGVRRNHWGIKMITLCKHVFRQYAGWVVRPARMSWTHCASLTKEIPEQRKENRSLLLDNSFHLSAYAIAVALRRQIVSRTSLIRTPTWCTFEQLWRIKMITLRAQACTLDRVCNRPSSRTHSVYFFQEKSLKGRKKKIYH